MSEVEELKLMLKITELESDRVQFIVLLDIDEDGRAHLQRRESSQKSGGFMSIHKMVGEVAKVGDYVYYKTVIVPGTQTMEIIPIKDPGYHKRIFEDYENKCMLDSYTAYIRDYKLNELVNEK